MSSARSPRRRHVPKQRTLSSSWPSAHFPRPWHPPSCQEPQGTFFNGYSRNSSLKYKYLDSWIHAIATAWTPRTLGHLVFLLKVAPNLWLRKSFRACSLGLRLDPSAACSCPTPHSTVNLLRGLQRPHRLPFNNCVMRHLTSYDGHVVCLCFSATADNAR